MNQVLSQLIPNSCLVYMDDIIVLEKDFDNHLADLRSVFLSLKQAGLTLNPSKCVLIRPRVKFLGHVVSATGVETDVDKVRQIREWPTPSDVTEVRSFLGLTSYYRRFIKDYTNIAALLHRLTQKEKKFKWTAECDGSFQLLKDSLCTSPVLVFPDISEGAGKFILDTDASDTAIGAVLSQQQRDGTEHVIQYLSRTLTKAERRYCVTRKEMLALTHFVEECRPYLQFRPFIPAPTTDESIDRPGLQAGSSHWDDDQFVEQYLDVNPEGGYAAHEELGNEQQVERIVEVPPEGGKAIAIPDAADDSRSFS
ncbi:hypothetical protein SprV_0802517800 [Sparganum proliferum]